jgi:hypothetical protein
VSHELEDVIVMGKDRKLRNFSDIIPESLKEAEGDLTFLLKPGEEAFGIEYYAEKEIQSLREMLVKNGGSYLKYQKIV